MIGSGVVGPIATIAVINLEDWTGGFMVLLHTLVGVAITCIVLYSIYKYAEHSDNDE